jgi:hypothetical protein
LFHTQNPKNPAANLFPVFFTLKRLAAKFVKPWRLAVGLALDGWRLVGTCSMFGLVWFGMMAGA